MEHFIFTKPGKVHNEDRVFSCDDFAFVIDGATCLTGDHYSKFSSDAEWYSNWWKEYLVKNLANTKKTIFEILRAGVAKIVKDYVKLSGGKEPEDFPSATVCIARRNNGKVEIYALGDSVVLLRSKTGESILIQDPFNCVNDGFNLMTIEYLGKQEKLSLIPAREKHGDIVLAGRKKKNKVGGYWVLSDCVEAVDHGIFNTIDEEIVDKIMLMTDGYAQVFDTICFMTDKELLQKGNSLGDIEKIYNKLYKLQDADPNGDKHLRFKLRDDASIAVMKF